MSKSNKRKLSETVVLPESNDATLIEFDLVKESATQVARAWAKLETDIANVDAAAVHVLLRADEHDLCPTVNLRKWAMTVDADISKKIAASLLSEVFGIDKPTPAARQRLLRCKLPVTALLREGGTSICHLSERGQLMVSGSTKIYKASEKKETQGLGELSVSAITRGARIVLKAELPTVVVTTKTVKQKLDSHPDKDVITELARRVRRISRDDIPKGDIKGLQRLFVQLVGLLAVNKDASAVDTDKIVDLYAKQKKTG